MLSLRHTTGLMLGAVTLAALLPLRSTVAAQDSGVPTINLSAGAFFEILAETDIEDPSVSFVLTQEREFLSASRDPLFRYRFLEPGAYFLTGELVSADGSRSHRRDIRIQVIPRETGTDDVIPEKSVSKQLGAVVDTLPLQQSDGTLTLEPHGLVRFLPVQRDLQSIALDLDVARDVSGDGDPGNDNQSAGTELGSASRALYLWFVDVETPREMRITAKRTNDEVLTQTLRLLRSGEGSPAPLAVPDAAPLTPPVTKEPVHGGITSQVHPDGSVRFSVSLRDPLPADIPFLYEWNFGDSSKSLLDHPLHTFPKPGVYTVELRIVDLRTYEERVKLRSDVQVTMGEEPKEIQERNKREESVKGSGGFGRMVVTILKLLSVLLLCAAAGAAIVFVIAKLKGRKLSDRLESAEKKIVGEAPKEAEESPPPMEITAEEVREIPEEEAQPPEPDLPSVALAKEGPEPEPEPATEPTPPAPSDLPEWLRTEKRTQEPGTRNQEPGVSPLPTPVVTPAIPSEPPAPNVAHDAFTPTPEQLTVDEEAAPSWLTQGLEGAKAEGQTPTAPPPPELANHLQPSPVTPSPVEGPPPPPPEPVLSPVEGPPPSPSVQPHPDTSAAPLRGAAVPDQPLTPEEKERLKKKRKRQRYRENVKKRHAEGVSEQGTENREQSVEEVQPVTSEAPADDASDEPIAIIRADSLGGEPSAPPSDEIDTPAP